MHSIKAFIAAPNSHNSASMATYIRKCTIDFTVNVYCSICDRCMHMQRFSQKLFFSKLVIKSQTQQATIAIDSRIIVGNKLKEGASKNLGGWSHTKAFQCLYAGKSLPLSWPISARKAIFRGGELLTPPRNKPCYRYACGFVLPFLSHLSGSHHIWCCYDKASSKSDKLS